MADDLIDFEPVFGSFIIETLTVGMYEEPRNALREYVQNAFDSIRDAVRGKIIEPNGGHIEVRMFPSQRELIIRDNGVGIPASRAAEVLTSIGASSKNYRREAGFRGIGRLAGIGFADKVCFSTKYKGESTQTDVTFDGARMRQLMAPESGSELTAQKLLRSTVTSRTYKADNSKDHFFQVQLVGFQDPPRECLNLSDMRTFLSQVAPVEFGPDFPSEFRAEIARAAADCGIDMEVVRISIAVDGGPSTDVHKPYGISYAYKPRARDIPDESDDNENATSVTTTLTKCDVYTSPTKRWFMWVGKKSKSGAFIDDDVWGLRVRVKNIQIDGTEIMGSIFATDSASNHRFNQWCVGEVYVRTDALVPNARRDGFEEQPSWKEVRREFATVCRNLTKEFRKLSAGAQLSIEKLRARLDAAKEDAAAVRTMTAALRVDRAIATSYAATDVQGRVEQALSSATSSDKSLLHALLKEATSLRTEMVGLILGEQTDLESTLQDARDEYLIDVVNTLEAHLRPECLHAVKRVVREAFGYKDV